MEARLWEKGKREKGEKGRGKGKGAGHVVGAREGQRGEGAENKGASVRGLPLRINVSDVRGFGEVFFLLGLPHIWPSSPLSSHVRRKRLQKRKRHW